MPVVRRYTYKVSSTVLGGQIPISLDYLKIPFQVSVLLDLVSGSINYAVEFTTDDFVNIRGDNDPANFRWLALPNLPAGQTATAQVTIGFPVTAVRLNIAAITGEARLSVIQGVGI